MVDFEAVDMLGPAALSAATTLTDTILQRKPRALIIDFSCVEALESSGLGWLITAGTRSKRCGVALAIVVREEARSVLAITRLGELFEVYPTLAAALIGMGKGRDERPASPPHGGWPRPR